MIRASGIVRGVRRALCAEWRLKIGLSIVLTLWFCVPYFTLQRMPIFPIRHLPLTRLDEWIGFSPAWVWPYQSVYVLMAVVPWLIDDRRTLRQYARGFMAMSAVGFACFLAMPIPAPRPGVLPDTVMFNLLVSYDGTLNSFPSLHGGLAVYTALLGRRHACARLPARAARAIALVLFVWCALILYGTLATKQHFAVDLPAGVLLAWAADRWARRASAAQRATGMVTAAAGV